MNNEDIERAVGYGLPGPILDEIAEGRCPHCHLLACNCFDEDVTENTNN